MATVQCWQDNFQKCITGKLLMLLVKSQKRYYLLPHSDISWMIFGEYRIGVKCPCPRLCGHAVICLCFIHAYDKLEHGTLATNT